MKYRNSLQITECILQATQEVGRDGINPTKLLRTSNVSTSRFGGFIDKLVGSGLINKIEQKGQQTYVITEKGIMYLQEYKKFSDFSDSFGLEL